MSVRKALLALLTLSFANVAQATIYSCTSQGGVFVDPDNGTAMQGMPDLRGSNFIVDTERGIRRGWVDEDYFGSCEIQRDTIGGVPLVNVFCNSDLDELQYRVGSLFIETSGGVLRFHAAYLGGGSQIFKGVCVVI